MDLETIQQMVAGGIAALLVLLGRFIYQKIKGSGHYRLSCKYPGCHFKVDVSDEKYSYICDDIMSDHQNRFHPLEFKETY